jgi:hypothetical protein
MVMTGVEALNVNADRMNAGIRVDTFGCMGCGVMGVQPLLSRIQEQCGSMMVKSKGNFAFEGLMVDRVRLFAPMFHDPLLCQATGWSKLQVLGFLNCP